MARFNSAILMLFLASQCFGQHQDFVVGIGQYLPSNKANFELDCYGTIISSRHVLTIAECTRIPSQNGKVRGVLATIKGKNEICECSMISKNFLTSNKKNFQLI